MRELLLGIDVGTTWCKAAVVSIDGHELAHARVPVPWRRVATGAEIEPARLVDVAVESARHALAREPDGRVAGLGVTGMAETGALLDNSERPVAPAIAWHDERGAEQVAGLAGDLGAQRFSANTGLPATPLCTLAKYRWLAEHGPDAVARAARWLSVGEWIVRRLGGEQIADLSLASRTGMLELDSGAPWQEALAWAGAPGDLLPAAAPSGTAAGRVTDRLDEARGAVLCVAGHDHLCAAIGAGAAGDGDLFGSCGSAEAFVRAVPSPLPPGTRLRAVAAGVTNGWHAVPGRQALLGAFEGGLALERAGRLLGAGDEAARRELDSAALATAAAGDGEPLLEGDPGAVRGDVPAAAMWRAALEALAARGASMVDTLEHLAGPADRIVVSGGGVRLPAARAARESAFGPFEHPDVEEAGARGAALLAGCAAEIYGGVDELPAPGSTPMEAHQ
jgi:sugar (pentulose or hexulose) kinase